MTFPVLEQGAQGPWDTVLQFNIGFPTGLIVDPANDDAPDGWGPPFVSEGGAPINPPQGTIGGTPSEVLVRRGSPATAAIVNRGSGVSLISQHTEDWRSDYFDTTGDIIRWVPQSENRIGAISDDGFGSFECPDTLGTFDQNRTIQFKNRLIISPREIFGAAIFTRPVDQKKFFIVCTIAGLQLFDNGFQVYVRPVENAETNTDSNDTLTSLADLGGSIDNLTVGWAQVAGSLVGLPIGVDARQNNGFANCLRGVSSFRFTPDGVKWVFGYGMQGVAAAPGESGYFTHQIHEIDPTSLVITSDALKPPTRTDRAVNFTRVCDIQQTNDFPDCGDLNPCSGIPPNDKSNITNEITSDSLTTTDSTEEQTQTIAWDWDQNGVLVELEWHVLKNSILEIEANSTQTTNGDYCTTSGFSPCIINLIGGTLITCEFTSTRRVRNVAKETWDFTIKGGPGNGLSISWDIQDLEAEATFSGGGDCDLVNLSCVTASFTCSGTTNPVHRTGVIGSFSGTSGTNAHLHIVDLRYGHLGGLAQLVDYIDDTVTGTPDSACLNALDCPAGGPCGKPGIPRDAPIPIFLGPNILNPNIQTQLQGCGLGVCANCNPSFPGCTTNCVVIMATRDTHRDFKVTSPTMTPGEFDRTFRDQISRQGVSFDVVATPGPIFHSVPLLVASAQSFSITLCQPPNDFSTSTSTSEVTPILAFAGFPTRSGSHFYRNMGIISWATDRFGDLAYQLQNGSGGGFLSNYWFNGPEPLRPEWRPVGFISNGTGGEDAQDDEHYNFYTFTDLDTLLETPGGTRTRYHPMRIV